MSLRGTKKPDLFQPARMDGKHSVESVVSALAGLIKEGKFNHIGLSEVRAETLRRGHAVRMPRSPALDTTECPFSFVGTPYLHCRDRGQPYVV